MTVKLKINGPIISNDDKWFYDWFEEDATCPNDIIDKLPSNGEDVIITINSGGGLVDQGNEIYTALKSYEGKVTLDIIMAGSASSIIAMAGHTRISPVGQIMIHNVSMGCGGDYHDMDKASEILQKANKSLCKAYELKTGKTQEELLDLMDKETWLTADEAKEHGFVDEILFQTEERPALVASNSSNMVSPKLMNKVKELMGSSPKNDNLEQFIETKINDVITKIKEDEKPKSDKQQSVFEGFFFS